MKKIKPMAFWLIMGGICASAVWFIVSTIISFTSGGGISAQVKDMMLTSGQQIDEAMIESLVNFVKVFVAIVLGIVLIIYAYFASKLMKNRKLHLSQGYITVLLVFNIIGFVFNILSVFNDPLIILNLAINAAIIVGCFMQKQYITPAEIGQDELLPQSEDVFPGH